MASCGMNKKLSRKYVDQSEEVLKESFGDPVSVIDKTNETIYIFEKSEKLGSTEISQGRMSLDPIITPVVTKTERYIFRVKDGIIVETGFEKEYER